MTHETEPGQSRTPAAEWTVRGSDRDEFPEVVRVVGEALLAPDTVEERLESVSPLIDAHGYDRILVATDADEVVGSVNAFPFEMTMPGGPRPVAGVTGVGVWPTHRRKGVLSALMRRQLRDLRARGESLAALWASEGGIYGRFGYGAASTESALTVAQPHSALIPDAPRDPALTLRLLSPEQARDQVAEVFRREVPARIGRFQRQRVWWDRVFADTPNVRGDRSFLKVALVSDVRGPVGYALYRTRRVLDRTGWQSELRVQELVAGTPAARVALYDHVFNRDLVASVVVENTAVDDPLWNLLADRQRITAVSITALWMRLVDVPAALAERSYAASVETVVEIADRYAPWNAGRWRIKADEDGAGVELTDDAPDLSLDVSHLGAAFLGQHTLAARVAAGVVTEHAPGAAARLDAALRVAHAPVCGLIF
ncbi:GNAT family N-acetyltransferase [Nocardiopsis sp. CNR-923]|uniref:GNAT family N-acetyltransferase n=1 Tax=Nocardiopsis sp. CNR-923 TaxID=1904965 RepID=UPI00095B88F1|nr:GNAT family N-acetyltransferase [Nocardiopsis sp. CNR-923]OLT29652.1 GNAT family N-acetyltransferase [Nocardiopsis sp. CNR-923]